MRSLLFSFALVLASLLAATDAKGAEPPDPFATEVGLLRDNAHGHRMILLGEKHATAEIPQFVAALVADLSAQAPVVLALEFPRELQPELEHFLASDGGDKARAALESGSFWQVQDRQHDGRRNKDVFDMFERVRLLRTEQRDVRLLPFDVTPGSTRDHHQRDQVMAAYLRKQYEVNPEARFVVLTGNVHAMIRKPGRAPPEMQQPMGSYLADLDPYAVNISARAGQFWGCGGGQCAVRNERPAQWESGPTRPDGAYHFQLVLEKFSVARLLGSDPAPPQPPH